MLLAASYQLTLGNICEQHENFKIILQVMFNR